MPFDEGAQPSYRCTRARTQQVQHREGGGWTSLPPLLHTCFEGFTAVLLSLGLEALYSVAHLAPGVVDDHLERACGATPARHLSNSTPSLQYRTHTSPALDHCCPSPTAAPHPHRLPCAAQYFTPSNAHPTPNTPRPTAYTLHPEPCTRKTPAVRTRQTAKVSMAV